MPQMFTVQLLLAAAAFLLLFTGVAFGEGAGGIFRLENEEKGGFSFAEVKLLRAKRSTSAGEQPSVKGNGTTGGEGRLRVNEGDENGATVMHIAVSGNSDQPEIVLALLQNGANVNARDKDERTPLLHALTSPVSTKSTFVLIENGADVNARSRLGNTPLQAAAVSGAPEDLIETLLKHGARVNDRNTANQTSLHHAAFYNHTAVVRILLEHGAEVDAAADDGITALIHAAKNGNAEMTKMLLEKGSNANARFRFVNASDEGGDIDDEAMTPPLTETALMMASRAGSAAGAEVAHLLIAHRADVNAKDITDWTALHYAIANDNVDVARVLLEADADPGVRAKHNGDPIDAPGHTTPLMMAIRRGNLAMVTLLLGHNKIAEIITTSTTKGPMMVV